jgi:tetratricopeptide (TPR) repeat protein
LKGFTPRAEENLRRVLQERPDDPEVIEALAAGCSAEHRWQEANDWYTRLVAVDPHQPDWLLKRGKLRLDATGYQFGRPDRAAEDFREVIRRRPDDFDARLYLAHSLLSDAKVAQARTDLLVCRKQRPDRVEPLVGLALCAAEDRQWDQAEGLLNEALALDPKDTHVLLRMGDLQLRRQNLDAAVRFYRQVLDLDPRNKGARLKLAQAYRSRGELDKAGEEERRYRELEAARAADQQGQ